MEIGILHQIQKQSLARKIYKLSKIGQFWDSNDMFLQMNDVSYEILLENKIREPRPIAILNGYLYDKHNKTKGSRTSH